MADREKASVQVHKESFGDKMAACFSDFFKSCYSFDKRDKSDPGDRKSAKLELIEVPTETGPSLDEPPQFKDIDKYPTRNSGSHAEHTNGRRYSSSDSSQRQALQSTDSFDFSEDSDYWKQAREVMKKTPARSALKRNGSERKHPKLVRIDSVKSKFIKIEEMLQQQPQEQDEYDEYEEGSEFDEYDEDEYFDDEYYDEEGFQYDEYGYPDKQDYQTAPADLYRTHAGREESRYYEDDPYGQFPVNRQRSEYTQEEYSQQQYDQYTENKGYPSNQQYHTEHAQTTRPHDYHTEHAQKPPDPPIKRTPSLTYRGSFKAKTERQLGGVVPSASYHKPLSPDEYKVDIRARVRALEVEQQSQEAPEPPKKPTLFTQGRLPVELSLPNYELVKSAHAARIGQPLYTHPGGYKFRIDLWANGRGVGVNTHISVTIHSLEGENNDKLTFPARFVVTLELLNQYSDYDHHQRKIECHYREGGYNAEIGRDLKFISKEEIYWNAERRTQYLLNDELRFRVTSVELI